MGRWLDTARTILGLLLLAGGAVEFLGGAHLSWRQRDGLLTIPTSRGRRAALLFVRNFLWPLCISAALCGAGVYLLLR
jgi:hypothetical protein